MASGEQNGGNARSNEINVGAATGRRRQRRRAVVDLTHSDEESEDNLEDDEVVFVSEKITPVADAVTRSKSRASKAPVSPKQGLKCPVCLEFKESDLCCPPCGHVICRECLNKVMATRMVCPMCRKRFTCKRVLHLHCGC